MANLPVEQKDNDFTDSELDKIQEYKDEGLPGIIDVTTADMHRMLELYLSGSSYTQISSILRIKKKIVLYLAHKSNWFEMKQEYFNEIQEKIRTRVIESKLKSSEFMLLMIQAYQRRIGNQFNRYLATGDEEQMDGVNLKELAQLVKAIEVIGTLDGSGKGGKTPPIGLNLGNGITVEKTGDNKITITPNEPATIGDALRQFAESKNQEKTKLLENQNNDIIKENKE